MTAGEVLLAASPVELELLRAERASVVADTLALHDSLATYDKARAAVLSLSDVDLAAVIHCESGRCEHADHACRDSLTADRSTLYVAAVDVERQRRKASAPTLHRFHTGEPANDTDAGGPAVRRPANLDRYRTNLDRYRLNSADADAAEDRRQRELGAARRNPERYAVWVHTGGAQFDGGAYAVATHSVTVDESGRETVHKVPALVYVAAVAEPPQVQAKRRKSTTWRGASAASDSVRLADVGHSPRQHANASTVYLPTPEGPRGYNGTLNGSPIRWQELTAEGAAWLHAVAGTTWTAPTGDSNDPRRVVGAVAIEPAASRTHHAVAIDYYANDGERRTYMRTRPLDHAGRMDAPADVVVGRLAHTARLKGKREDLRVKRPSGVKGQANTERMRRVRAVESCQLAATALKVGEPIRSNSRPARAVRAAVALSVMLASAGCPAWAADPITLLENAG